MSHIPLSESAAAVASGTLTFAGPVEQTARMVIAALEGAMLIARPYHDTAVLDAVIARRLADLEPRT